MDNTDHIQEIQSQVTPLTSETKKARRVVRLDELDEQDKKIFIQEFENAVIYFTEANFPLFLEGFGILFPITTERRRITLMRDKYVVHTENIRSLAFEKCNELVSLHRERFQGILELKDLAARVHEKSVPFLSHGYSVPDIRKFTRSVIDLAKREVVETGRSRLLKSVGEFYALHNRQGDSMTDWYAGADILIKPKFQKVLSAHSSRFLDRPIFLNAAEPFAAMLGEPLTTIKVDLQRELKQLGWEIHERDATKNPFSITVFCTQDNENPGKALLTYVSDGLRTIGIEKNSDECGNECVIQALLEAPQAFGQQGTLTIDTSSLPAWPIRLFTAAWVLLHSAKGGRVKPGAGLHVGGSALFDDPSHPSTIFTTRCKKLGGEQLCENGSYEYLNLIAVTEDEAQVAAVHGAELLLTLLEHKKLADITKPHRSSIVSKTSLLATH